MRIKPVVKVMNFHSLIRVDSARKRADKYASMENELSAMISIILNNENLKLDKKFRLPDPNNPELNIFLGSDFGFCGSVNSYVSNMIAQEGGTKIVIGKKLRNTADVDLFIYQEDFEKRFDEICVYLKEAVTKRTWSSVNVIYNKYCDISAITPIKQKIYPLDVKPSEEESDRWDDFAFEGNEYELLEDLFYTYLQYELKIAVASSFAAENITRQNATTESLKKLDEIEEEEIRVARKEHTQASFEKTIDSFIKQKALKSFE